MGAVATQAGDAADTGVLLHVGYHKTDSTWMQRQLFAREHTGCCYVGRNYQARRHLVRPHALDLRPAGARRALASELCEAAARGLVPVVSDERLSGNPHSAASTPRRSRTAWPPSSHAPVCCS